MSGCVDVLVVDDHTELRELVGLVLSESRKDLHVRLAGTGQEAVQALRAGYRPALILTDLMMPGMSGETLLKWVRAHHPAIPVVAVTSAETDAPFDDYLAKPLDMDELLGCATRWLPPPSPAADVAIKAGEQAGRGRMPAPVR